jgi:hypothetical protein
MVQMHEKWFIYPISMIFDDYSLQIPDFNVQHIPQFFKKFWGFLTILNDFEDFGSQGVNLGVFAFLPYTPRVYKVFHIRHYVLL